MSKNNKKKVKTEEVIDTSTLSKKELYDLNKKKKEKNKEKVNKTKKKKKIENLGSKIFAIVMLILMIASIFAGSLAYLN